MTNISPHDVIISPIFCFGQNHTCSWKNGEDCHQLLLFWGGKQKVPE